MHRRMASGRGSKVSSITGGAALAGLERVDLSGLDPRVATLQVQVACDVENALLGLRGCSAVFGPQKGATISEVHALDAALTR